MANEFIIRKGFISLDSSSFKGNLTSILPSTVLGPTDKIIDISTTTTGGYGTRELFKLYADGNVIWNNRNYHDIINSVAVSGRIYWGNTSNDNWFNGAQNIFNGSSAFTEIRGYSWDNNKIFINNNWGIKYSTQGGAGVNPVGHIFTVSAVVDSTTKVFSINNTGADLLTVLGSGGVGIGISTPTSSKLDVRGTTDVVRIVGSGYGNTLRVDDPDGTTNIIGTGIQTNFAGTSTYGSTNGSLQIISNGLSRIFVKSTGETGIGTTTPVTKLDVNGNISLSGSYNVTWRNSAYQYINLGGNGSGDFISTYGPLDLTLYDGVGFSGYSTQIMFTSSSTKFYKKVIINDSAINPTYSLEVSGSQKIYAGALGVGVNPNATQGRIDASNDIVAYSSDKRLKTNVQFINEPLEKINKLSGFTYNWNNIASEVAKFDTEERLIGIFAQDVQEVLPEAVKLAPFDNDGNNNSISGKNYLTVQYEKIVPLLIEAIKEQQKQIEELKIKVDVINR